MLYHPSESDIGYCVESVGFCKEIVFSNLIWNGEGQLCIVTGIII